MDISGISGGTPAAATPASSPSPATAPGAADTQSAAAPPADTVTLSPAAQQAVADADNASPSLADLFATKAANSTDPKTRAGYAAAALVMDSTGKYSQDEQLDAYNTVMGPGWQGNLSSSDWRTVFLAVRDTSALGQRIHAVADTYNKAAMMATQTGASNSAQGIAQAQLDAANAMSDSDRKLLFATGTQRNSTGTGYSDEQQWLAALQDQASGTAAAPSTPFARNATTFYGLAAIVNNVTGKYSQDDQLEAYVAFQKFNAHGELAGTDRTASALSSQTATSSAMAVLQQKLYDQRFIAVRVGYLTGGAAGSLQADLNWFEAKSDFEQKSFFETGLSDRYASIDQFKAAETAGIQLHTYLSAHLDEHGLPSQQELQSNPTLAKAWTIACNNAIKPQDLIDQVSDLLGSGTTDGSEDAGAKTAVPTDGEKALATLKAYAAGDAPQTDDQKALAALKAGAAAEGDGSAALQLLKQAAEAAAKPEDAEQGTDAGQPPAAVKQTSAWNAAADKTDAAFSATV
jgi:hypothetical protein